MTTSISQIRGHSNYMPSLLLLDSMKEHQGIHSGLWVSSLAWPTVILDSKESVI